MLFNSYVFLFLFLPLVLLAWWVPRTLQLRLALLVLASYVFYAGWDYRFCWLMLLTTVMDYMAAGRIARGRSPRERKSWLVAALTFNLGLLAYFKYAGFFTQSVNGVAHTLGLGSIAPTLAIVLPLGISFYTFESMSYTIDVYRGIAKPAKSFLHYMLFISIFPKLIAGPIIRYTDVEDQYAELRGRVDYELMWRGTVFFVIGMVKKVLIADQIAAHAAPLMAVAHPGLAESWVIVGSYTLQIYFDFSGYSDMAVGLGYMLGFRFPQNFNRPYIARNISEFWDRWHITFSRWLRDYLFIPLGGSRRGALRTLRNLFVVMFLGGLWHGASWTFVAWGVYHGTLPGIYHSTRMLRSRGILHSNAGASGGAHRSLLAGLRARGMGLADRAPPPHRGGGRRGAGAMHHDARRLQPVHLLSVLRPRLLRRHPIIFIPLYSAGSAPTTQTITAAMAAFPLGTFPVT